MRGEYIRGDGLVIPNNVTQAGQAMLLAAALRSVHVPLQMILGSAVYTPTLGLADFNEPGVGVGGYARQALNQVQADWPNSGAVNGQAYLESKPVVFPAGIYDKAVSRLALIDTGSLALYTISGPLPSLQMTVATPIAERTFRYRLYLG